MSFNDKIEKWVFTMFFSFVTSVFRAHPEESNLTFHGSKFSAKPQHFQKAALLQRCTKRCAKIEGKTAK